MTDCSNLKLTSIPELIPTNTTKLLLSGNEFKTIYNNSFNNLHSLIFLDLNNCKTTKLDKLAFSGLLHLHVLLLNNEQWSGWDNLVVDSEISLPFNNTLKELDIAGNKICSPGTYYLSSFITRMPSLISLKLNLCPGVSLNNRFSNLQMLETLTLILDDIGENFLPNDMFTPLKGLVKKVHIHTGFEMWVMGKILPLTPGNTTFKFLPALKVSKHVKG